MTTVTQHDSQIELNAPIPTWFKIGGGADRLARPADAEAVARCLETDPDLRVLGDGANLLVHDDGIGELVVSLERLAGWEVREQTGRVHVGAGTNLPKLIVETVRAGLAGLEGLGGIPATLGGALRMNAGGAYGEIATVVHSVHALDRTGAAHTLTRDQIDFGYRRSGLQDLIILSAELDLAGAETTTLRERLKEVMAYKKASQPMAASSAGCAFKNPTLDRDVDGVGESGLRVSAGMLADRAGCKGLRINGAAVSERHANFIVTDPGARASDVIALMDAVRERVGETFGITIEREVVVWERG